MCNCVSLKRRNYAERQDMYADKSRQASVRLTLINGNFDHMRAPHEFRVSRQFFCFFLRCFTLLIACVMQSIKCFVFASIKSYLFPLICVATLSCVRCTTITFRGNNRTMCDDAALAAQIECVDVFAFNSYRSLD